MNTWKIIPLSLLLLLLVLTSILVLRTLLLKSDNDQSNSVDHQSTLTIDENLAATHLAKALTFKTISTQKGDTQYADQFTALQQYLTKTYPTVFSQLIVTHIQPFGLLLVWHGSDSSLKPILLMSHQDVVPIDKGTEELWQEPPFDGKIANGFIWGRGALDIKSGVLGILEATEILLKKNFQPKRSIYIFFGDDEETGGTTAASLAKTFQQDHIHFAYVLDEGSAIFKELLPSVKAPVAFISLAEKGYMDIKLSTTTEGGHSSMPPTHTSIGIISRAITRLENNPFPAHFTEIQSQMLKSVAPYMSFSHRLVVANLWLFKPLLTMTLANNPRTNATIRTTTAPTIFQAGVKENVLPIHASANINFRILPGDTTDSVVRHVKKIINDPMITLTIGQTAHNPSPISSTKGIGYQTIKNTLKSLYANNIIIAPYLTVGATDSRHFIPVADDVYRFMCYQVDKNDVKRIHGTDERISTENFSNLIKFYYQLISQT